MGPKGRKVSWSLEDLESALDDMRKKKRSLTQVVDHYHISKTTIIRHLKKGFLGDDKDKVVRGKGKGKKRRGYGLVTTMERLPPMEEPLEGAAEEEVQSDHCDEGSSEANGDQNGDGNDPSIANKGSPLKEETTFVGSAEVEVRGKDDHCEASSEGNEVVVKEEDKHDDDGNGPSTSKDINQRKGKTFEESAAEVVLCKRSSARNKAKPAKVVRVKGRGRKRKANVLVTAVKRCPQREEPLEGAAEEKVQSDHCDEGSSGASNEALLNDEDKNGDGNGPSTANEGSPLKEEKTLVRSAEVEVRDDHCEGSSEGNEVVVKEEDKNDEGNGPSSSKDVDESAAEVVVEVVDAPISAEDTKEPAPLKETNILRPEDEELLAKVIEQIRSDGSIIGADEVRAICYHYVVNEGIPHNFSDVTQLASAEWYHGFCNRFPSVVEHKKRWRPTGREFDLTSTATAGKGKEAVDLKRSKVTQFNPSKSEDSGDIKESQGKDNTDDDDDEESDMEVSDGSA